MSIKNQRILLTGATGGIGQHLAMALVNKGAKLVLTGRNTKKLAQLKQALAQQGHVAVTIACDLNAPQSSRTLLQQIETTVGTIDMVICNAGVMEFTSLETQTHESIANMLQTNVTALIQLSQTVLKRFKRQDKGHFVFIGSIFGSLGFPHFATYCASKFAVHGFSQALRRELVDTNIAVTYIAPRGVNTPMNDAKTRAMFEASGNQMDDPEKVATKIVNAIEHQKQEVYIGQPESFFAWLNGLFPRLVNLGLKQPARQAREFL